MKDQGLIKRLFALAVLVAFIAIPEIANAKFSKASSSFSYDGVTVKVVDRRDQIGRAHHNTYGYTDFENHNDVKVDVNWVCYGVLKSYEGNDANSKLVKLSDGSFALQPMEKRGEVYSYRAGKYAYKDFSHYVVAIEVIKEKPAPEPEVVPDKIDDNVYNRVMKHKREGRLTQDDYSDALDWLDKTYDKEILTYYNKMWALQEKGDEKGVDRLIKKSKPLFDSFAALADLVEDANVAGELNSKNAAKLNRLKKKIESGMY